MAGSITLISTEGKRPRKEYVFGKPMRCKIGRDDDCHIQFPDDDAHVDISRQHCLLSVQPPRLWIRDLGSKHGTFVNGDKIGQRGNNQTAADVNIFPDRELKDGDCFQIGEVQFRVCIFDSEKTLRLASLASMREAVVA